VEFARKQWDSGIGEIVVGVKLHASTRVFRGVDTTRLKRRLVGTKLIGSEARGKQMVFQFSGGCWLGLHLGMTGKLSVAEPEARPAKHDHLILYQHQRALVFSDMRQFGRVRFDCRDSEPGWWSTMPAALNSRDFTLRRLEQFLARHSRLSIKGALLLQSGFPGVGNWMADEILWRAKIYPGQTCRSLNPRQQHRLWRETRLVCRTALRIVGKDFSDPPADWLFHERWKRKGHCPIHRTALRRDSIAGRTSAWCPRCQRPVRK
jgi:formamidopyrimidine-DNA glycosylase